MSETTIEILTTVQTVETITGTATTIDNVAGTSSVVETVAPTAISVEVLDGTQNTLEVPAQSVVDLEVTDAPAIDVEVTTGPTGRTPQGYRGAAPPDANTGTIGDWYIVDQGPTIGDFYTKTAAGWGTALVNLRGGIASVNGISGTNIVIGANNITTGVLISFVPQ